MMKHILEQCAVQWNPVTAKSIGNLSEIRSLSISFEEALLTDSRLPDFSFRKNRSDRTDFLRRRH